MSDTDRFITRNSMSSEDYSRAQAEARMAARRAEPAPEQQQWGDVGQGMAGREPVARGELPGQPNHTSSPLNLN
jgi:hypothetical protein